MCGFEIGAGLLLHVSDAVHDTSEREVDGRFSLDLESTHGTRIGWSTRLREQCHQTSIAEGMSAIEPVITIMNETVKTLNNALTY